MTWIPWPQLLLALVATVVLSFFHFVTPYLFRRGEKQSRTFASFAGGVAVAFIFLHMLPELVEQNEPIGRLMEQYHFLTPLGDLSIFIAALAGFLIYYGLEVFAEKKRAAVSNTVYRLHMATFCLYNFLITYTMTLRIATGLFFSLIFIIAMSLHFMIIDRKFNRLYPGLFSHAGRFVLVGALFCGWIVSVIFDPVNVLVVAMMTAFLSGSILLNVFREELPMANKTRYQSFLLGAVLVTIALLVQAFWR
jgi:hypothetical protein